MEYVNLLLTLAFGIASFFVAKAKNRNPWFWLLLGLLFSFVALLALAVLPKGDLEDEVSRLKASLRRLEEAKKREAMPKGQAPKINFD